MLEPSPTAAFDDSLAEEGGAVATLVIPPTDGERLMRFRCYRDEAAFAKVVETHAKMVWGVCSQILRHQQDVEDAFQATFLILARKAGSIRASESAAGWIYRVAYRTALLAHSRRSRRNEAQLVADLPSLDDQLSEIERNEMSLRMLEELNALPLRYRQPLVLCYMEGNTRGDAAAQMGVSTQTIKGLLARGTRLLRSRLIRRGIALSTSMAVVNSAMSAAQAAAAPTLVSSTAALGTSFALKLKLTTSGLKGASLKSVAACALAEKGIVAMTIAAASKPAVGFLGVCLAVGMLAVADAEPSKRLAAGTERGHFVLISTEAGEQASEETEGDAVETTIDVEVEEVAEVAEVAELDLTVAVDAGGAPTTVTTVAGAPQPQPAPSPNVVIAAPPAVPGLPVPANPPVAPTAMALSVAGTPPVQVVEDVLIQSNAPLVAPRVEPLVRNFEIARDFHLAVDQNARAPIAPASASGGSEAALKLEGEYWALKAEGLKKKAQAIELKVERARMRAEQGVGQLDEGEILDLSAEKDLALAEVKLCEMNAQRVRDSLEQRVSAEDQQTRSEAELKQVIEKLAADQAAAAEDAKRQALVAAQAIEVAKDRVEVAKAVAAKAARDAMPARLHMRAPAIKIERRVLTPPKPDANDAPEPKAPPTPDDDLATLPKVELKRLLLLAKQMEELQEKLAPVEKEGKPQNEEGDPRK